MRAQYNKRNDQTSPDFLLSVEQVADLVGISRSAAYAWLRAGIIPCQRVGTHFVVHRTEVEEWIQNGRRPETPPTPAVPAQTAIALDDDIEIVITVRRRGDKN